MIKVNNKDARTTPMVKHTQKICRQNCRRIVLSVFDQWCRSGVFIVTFEHISHLVLVFLLQTLSK